MHAGSPASDRNGIVIDSRWLATGLGTYTYNLVAGLKAMGTLRITAVTMPKHESTLAPLCDQIKMVSAPMYSVREQVEMLLAVGNQRLLHVPHYNVPLGYRGTLLVTIHDLTHLLDKTFRTTWKSRLYARPMLKLAASKAEYIFTVSEYSKRQMVEHLDVPAGKIEVAYNGVSSAFQPQPHLHAREETGRAYGFDGPYILYVGNLKPHKNVAGLIRAFAVLRDRESLDHKLVIVGDDVLGAPELKRMVADANLEAKIVFVPSVAIDRLPSLYSGADLTVLPSFEEGFGLPILESMACGTPVACSSAASMPEVAGDAAEYFDPHQTDSIAQAIESVLLSSERHEQLRTRGIAQAAQFTWEASVKKHYAVYKGFLN